MKVNSAIKIEILICCPYTFPIEVEGRNNCFSVNQIYVV